MPKPHILIAVGARPNFMKAAPLLRALRKKRLARLTLIHTGQHYDREMSSFFFRDLGLPRPAVNLGVGSCPRDQQIRTISRLFKNLLLRFRPDAVIVVGDVNSTLACALATRKTRYLTGTPSRPDRRRPLLVHVEAGLRSFDWTMPEEGNRILTDHLSDLLFAPSPDAVVHLRREAIPRERIVFAGNVMIDSLKNALRKARSTRVLDRLRVRPKKYALVTLHRPSNVDDPASARQMIRVLNWLAGRLPVVFPIHPRTRTLWEKSGLFRSLSRNPNLILTLPLGYLDFLKLMGSAAVVLTDSGGIQEETTILGVPCLTLRNNTERPITLTHGTNRLAGVKSRRIIAVCRRTLERPPRKPRIPPLWDGRAGTRIARELSRRLGYACSD